MDESDIGAALESLAKLLAAVECGDLEASSAQVGALLGASEVLKALQQPTD